MSTKSLNKSLAETILTAASGTATGLGYATPAAASLISYQITFGTEPSVENITIEGSTDNSSWSVLATSTAIVNNTGYVITALPFIRAKINTNTGGLVVNVVVIAKPYTLLNPASGDGTPGGSTTQLQYNNGGVFGGIAEAAYVVDEYIDITFPADGSGAEIYIDETEVYLQSTLATIDLRDDGAIELSNDNVDVNIYPSGSIYLGGFRIEVNNAGGGGTDNQAAALIVSVPDSVLDTYDAALFFGADDGVSGVAYSIGSEGEYSAGVFSSYRMYLFDQINEQTIWFIDDANPTSFIFSTGISVLLTGGNLLVTGVIRGSEYRSGDDSIGIDTTITTADLVGKTITVKDGLITGFA